MNFFKVKTSWSNAEFITLKLCIATAYLLIGAYFHRFIHDSVFNNCNLVSLPVVG